MEHHYSWVIPNTRRVILPGSTTVRIKGPRVHAGANPQTSSPNARARETGVQRLTRPYTGYQVRVHVRPLGYTRFPASQSGSGAAVKVHP